MAENVIIGSGILGLSIAEYLTRTTIDPSSLKIISNEHKLAGSNAAAANLATKGQLYARDPHFHLKLEAKKIYRSWLENLLNELNKQEISLDSFYKNGWGIDYFYSKENKEKQYNRVKQCEEELKKRNLPNNSILSQKENIILYKDESWVDAHILLDILRKVLLKRKVKFENIEINYEIYKKLNNSEKYKNIIFCTGAWTKDLLKKLNIAVPSIMEKQRLTFGSTFSSKNLTDLKEYSLVEKVSADLKNKVTISGSKNRNYISSTTVKISEIENLENLKELNVANNQLLKLAEQQMLNCPFYLTENNTIKQLDGVRVGFGHSEIVLTQLSDQNLAVRKFVCAGAHKSGYLFAPVIGAKLQKMLIEI